MHELIIFQLPLSARLLTMPSVVDESLGLRFVAVAQLPIDDMFDATHLGGLRALAATDRLCELVKSAAIDQAMWRDLTADLNVKVNTAPLRFSAALRYSELHMYAADWASTEKYDAVPASLKHILTPVVRGNYNQELFALLAHHAPADALTDQLTRDLGVGPPAEVGRSAMPTAIRLILGRAAALAGQGWLPLGLTYTDAEGVVRLSSMDRVILTRAGGEVHLSYDGHAVAERFWNDLGMLVALYREFADVILLGHAVRTIVNTRAAEENAALAFRDHTPRRQSTGL